MRFLFFIYLFSVPMLCGSVEVSLRDAFHYLNSDGLNIEKNFHPDERYIDFFKEEGYDEEFNFLKGFRAGNIFEIADKINVYFSENYNRPMHNFKIYILPEMNKGLCIVEIISRDGSRAKACIVSEKSGEYWEVNISKWVLFTLH